jgi:hypothetical protein
LPYGLRLSGVFPSTAGDPIIQTYTITAAAFRNLTGVALGQSSVYLRPFNEPGSLLGSTRFAVAFVALLAAFASPAVSFAQSTAIAGLVTDATGAVLPGVTVEASSPALIEQVRVALGFRYRSGFRARPIPLAISPRPMWETDREFVEPTRRADVGRREAVPTRALPRPRPDGLGLARSVIGYRV